MAKGTLLPHPPQVVLLVHGSGSGPWVFNEWAPSFPWTRVIAPDLLEALDHTTARMDDYAERVVAAARDAVRPLLLVGWSMGGLVAMMAARQLRPDAIVLLEPSPPGEVQGFHPSVEVENGTFDPEDAYGPFPPGVRKRPESSLARAERKRGISVPTIQCPSLFVSSGGFGDDRGRALTSYYGGSLLEFPLLSHWDLVFNAGVRQAIASRVDARGDAE